MSEKYKLTYFNLKAVGEPIRFIFAYAGVDYEDNRIERSDWPSISRRTPWGQLPILQVNDKVLAQSNTICRYLGKKFDLVGKDEWEAAKIDEIADTLTEFRGDLSKVFGEFAEKDEKLRAQLQETFTSKTLPLYFGNWEAAINRNGDGPYLVGKQLTWIDLQMAHYIDLFNNTVPDSFDEFPKLRRLKEVVFRIPNIQAWVEKRPLTNI